jgi:hypothetical protein
MPHGFTWGLVLLKDLPKTANTVRHFHAQIKIMKNGQYLQHNIHNVVNVNKVNKAIMTIFKHGGF